MRLKNGKRINPDLINSRDKHKRIFLVPKSKSFDIKQIQPPASIEQILLSNGNTINNTFVVSDLEGTICRYMPNGISSKIIQEIATFLKKGGSLVILTADPFCLVDRFFLQPLMKYPDFPAKPNLYILSSFGRFCTKVEKGNATPHSVIQEKFISPEKRNEIIDVLAKNLPADYKIQSLNEKGEQIGEPFGPSDLKSKVDLVNGSSFVSSGMPPSFFIDVEPNKVTFAPLPHPKPDPNLPKILKAVQTAFLKFDGQEKIQYFGDGPFAELNLYFKDIGIVSFLQKNNSINLNKLIVVGDSGNDSGMLDVDYTPFGKEKQSFFVGDMPKVSAHFQPKTKLAFQGGGFADSTAKIFETLNKTDQDKQIPSQPAKKRRISKGN